MRPEDWGIMEKASTTRFWMTFVTAVIFMLPLLQSQVARADEPAAGSDSMFGATPMPCTAEAIRLLNRQLLKLAPDEILSGIRQAMNRPADWTTGHPSYEKARSIVVAALDAEEKANGPLFTYTPARFYDSVVANWSAEERSNYKSFFSKPAGQIYLTDMLDGAACKGWLDGLTSPPFPPLDGPDKARLDTMMIRFIGGEQRLVAKLRALSMYELENFVAESKKLGKVFNPVLMLEAAQDAALTARMEKAVEPHMAEISAIANTPQVPTTGQKQTFQ